MFRNILDRIVIPVHILLIVAFVRPLFANFEQHDTRAILKKLCLLLIFGRYVTYMILRKLSFFNRFFQNTLVLT